MIYYYIVLFFLNINFVSSTLYSCDRSIRCGCSKNNADLSKIVGGESAIKSSWGWAVSLQDGINQHFCGGAIISPLDVITAAHCVDDLAEIFEDIMVVAGIDILSESSFSMAQVRSVVRVTLHPAYNKNSHVNDIAILRLNQPLNISNEKGTARICVPHVIPIDTASNFPIPDSSLVAIGWGVKAAEQTSIPKYQQLQQVTLNAMSATHRMCIQSIYNRQLQFCAGVIGGGKDTCQGDSGGPLMHFDSSHRQWALAGITSYGKGCADPNYAGVYTRTSVYYNWLQSVVTNNFTELSIIGTNLDLTDSARHLVSPFWSLLLSLYLFANK